MLLFGFACLPHITAAWKELHFELQWASPKQVSLPFPQAVSELQWTLPKCRFPKAAGITSDSQAWLHLDCSLLSEDCLGTFCHLVSMNAQAKCSCCVGPHTCDTDTGSMGMLDWPHGWSGVLLEPHC